MIASIGMNVISGLIGGAIVWSVGRCWSLGRLLPIAFQCMFSNKRIRISASHLIRIKIGDRFLLVKGSKINQWQPVGGVYKTYKDTESTLADLSVKYDDENTPHSPGCERDLRINIPRRNVIKFMRWFDSGKERESEPWREFYEELVETNILSSDDFKFIFARHIRRHRTSIHYSEHFEQDEILMADIFELVPTEEQKKALQALPAADDEDRYILLTHEDIKRRGFDKRTKTSLVTPLADTVLWTMKDLS